MSVAAREQSTTVRNVGEAVSTLDHATQQNAALVEQTAAVTRTLEERARVLATSVSRFKLAPGH